MGSWTEEGALVIFSSPPPLLDTAQKNYLSEIFWFDETRTFLNLFSQARKSSFSGSLIFFPAATVTDSLISHFHHITTTCNVSQFVSLLFLKGI